MNTSSKKAKGRRLQQYVIELLLNKYKSISTIQDGDIKCTIMGESGTDVKMSPLAESIIPFDIECKNQQNISIWKALKQTEANTKLNRIPLLIFSRNHEKTYAILEIEKLLQLLK